jgi:hypothetical protein
MEDKKRWEKNDCKEKPIAGIANKPPTVWQEAEDEARRTREGKIAEQTKLLEEMRKRKEEIRNSGIKPVPGGSL